MKNVGCDVKKTLPKRNEDAYSSILHLSRVELGCRLQENLQYVTVSLIKRVEFQLAFNVLVFVNSAGVIVYFYL